MKKIAAILCLLVLLTSCGGEDSGEVDDTNSGTVIQDNINGDDQTVIDINASGSLDGDEIFEDFDNLLNEIINSAENPTGTGDTSTGDTSTGTENLPIDETSTGVISSDALNFN